MFLLIILNFKRVEIRISNAECQSLTEKLVATKPDVDEVLGGTSFLFLFADRVGWTEIRDLQTGPAFWFDDQVWICLFLTNGSARI